MTFRLKISKNVFYFAYVLFLFFAVLGIRIWPLFYYKVSHGYNLDVFKHYNKLRNTHYLLKYFMQYDWWLNILLFMPFPNCLRWMMPQIKFCKIILVGILTSLSIECFQFIFDLGLADINDVISNTLGVIIGMLIMINARRIIEGRKRKMKIDLS